MDLTRRGLLGAAPAATVAMAARPRRARAAERPVIRIGVMSGMSGTYRDIAGPTSVICSRFAVEEFGDHGFDVEVIAGDHQDKPDVAASLAKQWYDRDGVDVIQDGGASSCALVIADITRQKDKVFLSTSTATSDLTGKACTPNTIHWVHDTYMMSRVTAGAMTKQGGDSWFFLTANYAFGLALQRDATKFVTEAGGKVLGANQYPFPETSDFSAALLQAQSSGAKVIGLANAGADTVNCIKQAHEFGIGKGSGPQLAALLCYSTDIHAVGLEIAQGLLLSGTFDWNLNDRTRAWMNRIKPKVTLWPNMAQAGQYSATIHYLKIVQAMGPAAAKASGAAAVARMKATPTEDDCFGKGWIREDGRKIHPAYLFQAKQPSESLSEWDLLKVLSVTPGEDAFRPLSEHACPLVKS
jgi:branched-chain amino acid transport system substrate-binding protein